MTFSTPGRVSSGIAMNAAVSPTSPMIVLVFPRDTNASPSASRTLSTTRSMSSSVALLFITTTITTSYSARERVRGRKAKDPGALARGPLVVLLLAAGGYAGRDPSLNHQ